MKRVLIAIDNYELYNNIKKEIDNIEIVSKDIIYREGVLEFLEDDNKINYVILNEKIIGEIKQEKLLKKIKEINKKIKIIFLSQSQEYGHLVDFNIEEFNIKKINTIINWNFVKENKEKVEYLKNTSLNKKIEN
ncbi:MAG: hypothetical protein Q4G05_03125, partial [Clostridia bacterium]|nr:hypothetical protein [Clostridia bacterium]